MNSSAPDPSRGSGRPKRVTIADIAREAGVTSAAVSLAVNGRSGVSDATRARILEIAERLDWQPSQAARALAGAPVRTVGMVLARPAEVLGAEAFFGGFTAGLQAVLSAADYSLQMKIVDSPSAEIDTYRRWFAQRRVDGVVMVDLRADDPRVPALEELDRPALVIGGPGHHGSLPSVYVDDARATELLVEHLAALGHASIARVAGAPEFFHTRQRDAAFERLCDALGIRGRIVGVGFGADAAARAVAELLDGPQPATAIILDSDEMALAGADLLLERGIGIPEDIAIATFEDSPLARTHRPAITAIGRSAVEYGRVAAERLLELIDARSRRDGDAEGTDETSETRVIEPTLHVRGSTDPGGAAEPPTP